MLYRSMGASDTVEGRFELLTLHVVLLLDRLKAQPDLRQALFDTYVSYLDGALREMGVGDLAVPKRMKALAAAFYGRARAFEEAFVALPDETQLRDVLARTILCGQAGADVEPLTAYTAGARDRLAGIGLDRLFLGDVIWSAAQ
jgi:cytochrome b pre-mRNA-processing protein 3